jgi:hypothetical protein
MGEHWAKPNESTEMTLNQFNSVIEFYVLTNNSIIKALINPLIHSYVQIVNITRYT